VVPLLPRALGDRAGARRPGWAPALPDHLPEQHPARIRGRAGGVHEDPLEVLARSAGPQDRPEEDRRHGGEV